MAEKKARGSCEYCAYYTYDEESEWYICDMDLDEDEMVRFLFGHTDGCPYFRSGDEYALVRHQN